MNTSHHGGSLVSYTIGFLLSIILTLAAFGAVIYDIFSGGALMAFICTLAVLQLLVQLTFFLHIGHDKKPRWNISMFLFTVLTLFILVAGTLWVMHNLDYNMMPPDKVDEKMMVERDKGF